MLRASLLLTITIAASASAGGPADKPAPKALTRPPHPAVVEGVLWHRDGVSVSPELAAGKEVVVGTPTGLLTGVFLYGREFGNADVHVPDDRVKKLARELNGRLVKAKGEIRYVVVAPKWFGDDKLGRDVLGPRGKKIWVPVTLDEMPKRRPVVWVTDLEAMGPKAEPWFGEPTIIYDGRKIHTFKRLPRAKDVHAVKISSSFNATLPGVKPVTLVSFGPLLDKLTPIKADDEGAKFDSRAECHSCRFETEEGIFQLSLYLGGRAILAAPDGRWGWVMCEKD